MPSERVEVLRYIGDRLLLLSVLAIVGLVLAAYVVNTPMPSPVRPVPAPPALEAKTAADIEAIRKGVDRLVIIHERGKGTGTGQSGP